MKKKIIIVLFVLVLVGVGTLLYLNLGKGEGSTLKQIFSKEEYKEYKSGDSVKFYDQDWYVMFDSTKEEDYVTLINSSITFLEELPLAINGIYETSDVNQYLKEAIAKEYGEDNLVELNGYSVRLLSMDDINKLVTYNYDEETDSYLFDDCPEFLCLTNAFYGTMIDTATDFEAVDVYNNVNDIENPNIDDYKLHLKYYNVYATYTEYGMKSVVDDATLFIRPVINVKKSALSE